MRGLKDLTLVRLLKMVKVVQLSLVKVLKVLHKLSKDNGVTYIPMLQVATSTKQQLVLEKSLKLSILVSNPIRHVDIVMLQ